MILKWLVGVLLSCLAMPLSPTMAEVGKPWTMHVIDDGSRGADGVKLADVNGDGLPDITTGWEEGGITRVYVHPGYEKACDRWPAVTVGRTPNVEDAVLVDLDGDGRLDVVSSCEGRTQTMFVHWAPRDQSRYLDPTCWETQPLPASQARMKWMFCLPVQIDGRHGIDLLAAGKDAGCGIGWFESPADPRKLDDWRWRQISPAGWIMSLVIVDMDDDGDLDVLATDRKGKALRGCRWLENPGPGPLQMEPWKNHFIGGRDLEVMFLTMADLDADGADDILMAVRKDDLVWFRRLPGNQPAWETHTIAMPPNTGTGKGVGVGDIDADGKPDVVFSCEHADGDLSGVRWLSYDKSPHEPVWRDHEISGSTGIKFDRIGLIDIDGDGDLDVLTCEESHPVAGHRHGLGVIWYENPPAR